MKKISTIIFVFFTVLGLNAQVYFSEDFETGSQLTLDDEWYLGPADGIKSDLFDPSGNTSNFIAINDDLNENTSDPVNESRAYFGPVDLTMATQPFLNFDAFFLNGDYENNDETFKLLASFEGTFYFELFDIPASDWDRYEQRLDVFVGREMWFAFEYDDGDFWNLGAAVDNIDVSDYTIQNDVKMVSTSASCDYVKLDQEVFFTAKIQNRGLLNLNSFDLSWTDGVNSGSETIEGIDIIFREEYELDINAPASFTVGGPSNVTFTVSNPNGVQDENVDNSELVYVINAVAAEPRQAIVVEEATGTWCTWCPRGAVWLDKMQDCIGENFIPIAVHNNDPMELAAYDAGVTSFDGFEGFPSVLTDRKRVIDASELELPTVSKVTSEPDAIIGVTADWDDASRTLNVTGYADMKVPTALGYRWVGVLTEDGVTGTSIGYAQVNAYAGGLNGPMGGYEFLPDPVPAADMVYDHVGRALLANYAGATDAGLDNLPAGGQAFYDFESYTIPEEYNVENMHIIVMLLNQFGQIINATSTGLVEASVTGIQSAEFNHDLAKIYPNPASDLTNIRLDLEQASDVTLTVFNSMGQTMARKDYGSLSGDMILPFNTADLNAGNYFLHITVDEKLITKTLQVVK